jgi:hypothetical protein
VDEEDEEDQSGGLSARATAAHEGGIGAQVALGDEEEGGAHREACDHQALPAFFESGNEQARERGDRHHACRESEQERCELLGSAAEEEDRDRAQAGGQGRCRSSEKEDEHFGHEEIFAAWRSRPRLASLSWRS